LFNAAQPRSPSVQITGQKRNENQSTGEIAFAFHPPPNPSALRRVKPALLKARTSRQRMAGEEVCRAHSAAALQLQLLHAQGSSPAGDDELGPVPFQDLPGLAFSRL